MNPLFQQLNGAHRPTNNGFPEMLARFQEFKRSFSGDPKQKVQELLNSGRMSQAQFNQLSQMAKQFEAILKRS